MRVSNDGVTLNVQDDGPQDGPPVVFLHGVSGSRHAYAWLPPEILLGRRVLRVDQRGHGDSAKTPGAYGIEDYTGDAVAILRAVGRPAVLVGHSLGGCVAWTVAQRHPELVTAVFLEDPPLFYSEAAEFETSAARQAFPVLRDRTIQWQAEGASAETMSERIGEQWFGRDHTLRLREVLTDDALQAMGRAYHDLDPAVLQGAADNSTLEGIDLTAPVEAPVLLLAADESQGGVFAARHAERLHATHRGIEVVALDGCGHSIGGARRFRRAYLEQLTRFLDEHAPVAPG
ncbi:alpha/beta fold hydrolase [Capillimicrobium parvum]|uniref:2-succinyl-6-hydroxy-2, 4-cyclohexadiene-1-carboxylate synthase n=1 Tax=Capillimicrobium parvum TaxID=2884022 RepID=A0A9E6Y2X4_9ACTN|nr:alpha/beta hydrolase [Capillimicrobium parvum]UGS39219.1 2-succinyl-6-hydroxy-2,4-cyclohexadiene-1-carboxylate synthase [Capillimicrobium parvum]